MTVSRRLLLIAGLLGWCGAAQAQDEARLLNEAAKARVESWRGMPSRLHADLHWLPGDSGLVWRTELAGVTVWRRIDANGSAREGPDRQSVGLSDDLRTLLPRERVEASGPSQRRTEIRFVNETSRVLRLFWSDGRRRLRDYGELPVGATKSVSTFVGHSFVVREQDGADVGAFVAEAGPGLANVGERSQAALQRLAARRDPRAFVRDHDLWVRTEEGEVRRITDDGTENDGFVGPLRWSPDGRRAVVMRRVPGDRRKLTLIESSPSDQLQPKLHELDYAKPGDRIDRNLPYVVDVEAGSVTAVDPAAFADAWSIDRFHWAEDGSEVFCLYNRRGHQVLKVLAIDVARGTVRTVLEEVAATFVDYSQKAVLHWLANGKEFLWASERDGRNHLYRVDSTTGSMARVTQGAWVVRALERVDEADGTVWLRVMGVRKDEDPYHVHLARVGLDGGGFRLLTDADATHEWEFSPERTLFVDRWSRVDQPEVVELRRASDGALLGELGREDDAALLAAGWRRPVRFSAKGRDGETDIYGCIYFPSQFQEGGRYPVVEDIYAGPHDFHVPKAWGLGERQRRVAEMGIVVVRIDGMGTNWRSKKFHDVCWRNLKDGGFPDRILWMRAAAERFPQLDLDRVGIFGGSAGGQNALAALLHHGEFYKAAVADCGCHDNRMDKIWWNEAWMGYPIGPWYADSSNVTHADKLRGKLWLTVGELDRNVDPSSTMQVVAALLRAGREFDLTVVPGGGHGVGESSLLVGRRAEWLWRALR
ncbi:MAG: Prolyl tripeptidyl peptidase precursor [Planctomycetota bacterium]|jgi:dipeptidyl aminopeptidase/acylaminoacyl peptidase